MKLSKILLLILLFPLVGFSQLWVSTNGSDDNDGSNSKPFATVAMAVRKAREQRRLNDTAIANGIRIIVKGGVYKLDEPLFIRPEDSGTPTSPTTIEAAPNETPILSGGVNVTGWHKATGNVAGLPNSAQGKVWVANAPMVGGRLLEFRQLWINDQKAIRARDRNADSMYRILSWNHKEQTCWIPKPKTDRYFAGRRFGNGNTSMVGNCKLKSKVY